MLTSPRNLETSLFATTSAGAITGARNSRGGARGAELSVVASVYGHRDRRPLAADGWICYGVAGAPDAPTRGAAPPDRRAQLRHPARPEAVPASGANAKHPALSEIPPPGQGDLEGRRSSSNTMSRIPRINPGFRQQEEFCLVIIAGATGPEAPPHIAVHSGEETTNPIPPGSHPRTPTA